MVHRPGLAAARRSPRGTRRPAHPLLVSLLVTAGLVGCGGEDGPVKQFHEFARAHEKAVKPIQMEYNLAWWEAATTGEEEAFDRRADLELQLTRIYSSRDDFALLEEIRNAGALEDPIDRRLLDVLYLKYLGNQVDPELQKSIIEKSAAIEKAFTNFRGLMGGRSVTDNEIAEVLAGSKDGDERREAWEDSKQVGSEVAPGLLELVELRNQAARSLGFRDYFALSLFLTEVDEEKLFAIFDELDQQTTVPFRMLKARLDARLAEHYGIAPGEIMPWHYTDPFFQNAPDLGMIDLDAIYQGRDILQLLRNYYKGIGFEVDGILERSDLYEREGKNQHAFATDIDREGDVRTLMNLQPNCRWMETALHELGHGVYDLYIRKNVPWLLREKSHSITTEGIAMLFGRFARNAAWMESMGILTAERATEIRPQLEEISALQQLIFSRWCQVMVRFEKALYENPDRSDLNGLWWELRGRYQGLVKPAGRENPDWASKIHFTVAPVYYHSYMLGELFASQLHAAIAREVLGTDDPAGTAYAGEPSAGRFLIEKVFAPGNTVGWEELIEASTGRPLGAEDFGRQFMGGS